MDATTTYMRSCSSANPKIEKATRATGVAMRNSSPSWMNALALQRYGITEDPPDAAKV